MTAWGGSGPLASSGSWVHIGANLSPGPEDRMSNAMHCDDGDKGNHQRDREAIVKSTSHDGCIRASTPDPSCKQARHDMDVFAPF